MITYILFVVVSVFLLHLFFNFNKLARTVKKIPGPKDVFLLGNALEVNIDSVSLFKLARTYAKQFNGIFRVWIYPFAMVNIYNPSDIETVISTMKHSEKSFVYKFLKPWLNDGLLVSSGFKWHQRRKILTPTFHFNILRQFFAVMEENSCRLVEKLGVLTDQPVDIVPLISEYTLHTICETAMGTQLNKETSQIGKSYKDAIHKVGQVLVKRFVKVFYYADIVFNLSPLGRKQEKAIQVIHKFTNTVIKHRKMLVAEHKMDTNENNTDDDVNIRSKKRRVAMLDLLISAEKEGLIDQKGLQEEVDTFMFEGHDTTAVGITFTLMLLANHNKIQDKIIDELKEILGDTRRPITMEDLSKMRYLECCIKESLRLYPPVPFISRNISETVELSNFTVPAGTLCHIHIYDLHRREDLFENAHEFIPERFFPENSVDRHPYAYIPFSAGPRNCIGQKFAIYELKSSLVAILRNFKLLPITRPDDIEMLTDLVLRNNGPVQIKFVKRVDPV